MRKTVLILLLSLFGKIFGWFQRSFNFHVARTSRFPNLLADFDRLRRNVATDESKVVLCS